MAKSASRYVAFQGELGAFSHLAALKMLGERIKLLPCTSFRQVFEALRSGEAARAIVPIENTLHGSVLENYDHLLEYDFLIAGETSIRISHQLIAMPGVSFRHVTRAYSHPVALNQCKNFFQSHPDIKPEPYYDTAGSVKALMENQLKDAAAIASAIAADTYGGKILRRNIEDSRQNFTRFFLLTKQPLRPRSTSGAPKTSLVFGAPNTPGVLYRAMGCFALEELNLTKIESRPFRGKPWEYLFYVDFLGSIHERNVKRALANLRECTQFVKLLGSYRPTP